MQKNFIENSLINYKLTNTQDVLYPYCTVCCASVTCTESINLPTYRSASKGK